MPLRITVGARGLRDGVAELRDRRSKEVLKVQPEAIVETVRAARDRMMAILAKNLST